MVTGWLDKAGPYKIEHVPCPFPGGKVTQAGVGVMHTIEGSFASGLEVFRQHFAPTFAVGATEIAQLVPLGYMAAALENHAGGVETNSVACVQIEVEGHSSERPYDFAPAVAARLAALMATLEELGLVPLSRPYPDVMPAGPWATYDFARRHDGKFPHVHGWYGHVEIPENAHWDPGALRWTRLLLQAKSLEPKTKRIAPTAHPSNAVPAWYWPWVAWKLGEGRFVKYGKANAYVRHLTGAPLYVPVKYRLKFRTFVNARKNGGS